MDRRLAQSLDHYLTTPPEEPEEETMSEAEFLEAFVKHLDNENFDVLPRACITAAIRNFLENHHKKYFEVEFIKITLKEDFPSMKTHGFKAQAEQERKEQLPEDPLVAAHNKVIVAERAEREMKLLEDFLKYFLKHSNEPTTMSLYFKDFINSRNKVK